MITGAIFDMDGLMFDTETVYQKLWRDIGRDHGVELVEDFAKRISGSSGDVAAALIREFYHVDDHTGVFEECGRRMLEATKDHIDMKPGLVEILTFLRAQGVKCAVASGSSSEQIRQNLKTSGLEDMFDAIVGGTELVYGKPNPHIFLYAAEKLQCDSHDCFVFEDSLNGIRAAHAAEAHPIMIPDLTPPTDEIREMCDGIYKDLNEALEAIKTQHWPTL